MKKFVTSVGIAVTLPEARLNPIADRISSTPKLILFYELYMPCNTEDIDTHIFPEFH